MRRRGFTLVELLAVIIILSIVAVISVPIVTDLIENSKVSAAEASAKSVIKAAKVYYNKEQIEGNPFAGAKFKCDGISCKKCANSGCTSYDDVTLSIEGAVPDSGIIEISSIGEVYITEVLSFEGNTVYVGYDVEENLKGSTVKAEVVYGKVSSKTSFSIGKQMKFDPVNDTSCTSGDTCYTWNIIGVNNDTINIMMNENLGEDVYWSDCMYDDIDDNDYSCLYTATTLNTALSTLTTSWAYTARVISKSEIETIIGTTIIFSHVNIGKGYFGLSSAVATGEIQTAISSKDIEWLTGNITAGTPDPSGYWTSTHSGVTCLTEGDFETFKGCDDVFIVGACGNISATGVFMFLGEGRFNKYGIRPVITVEKEMF